MQEYRLTTPLRTVLFVFLLARAITVAMTQTALFDTSYVELDTSKMVTTGDGNYAIAHPNLPTGWKSVSANGDDLTIVSQDNQLVQRKSSSLSAAEKSALEAARASLLVVVRSGPFNVKSQTGLVKLTTFDRNGGTSSMGSGGSGGSSSSSSSSSFSGGISISKTGANSFIISRGDFPFNWNRLFVNDNIVTAVYKDGRVVMLPQDLMRSEERTKMVAIRREVEESTRAGERLTASLTDSLRNPMDFVSRAFGGLFG